MAKSTIAMAICWAALATAAWGQASGTPTAAPQDVGMSSQALSKIDQAMQSRVEAGELVGASVLVSRRGTVVYFHQFGLMDAEANKPFRPDTMARIYSMTKAITSVAAMMLYDQGKLALDDPVEKYLPELANRTVYDPGVNRPAKTVMTIRDLLRHTSGLIYGNAEGSPLEQQYQDADLLNKEITLKEFVDRLAPCRWPSIRARIGITACRSTCWAPWSSGFRA